MSDQLMLLPSHEAFEALYKPAKPLTEPVLLYFTASWCGACKKIDWGFLLEEFPTLKILKCDIDQNKYTPGFCGVRAIPSFLWIPKEGGVRGPLQSSDTAKVATWIQSNLVKG